MLLNQIAKNSGDGSDQWNSELQQENEKLKAKLSEEI